MSDRLMLKQVKQTNFRRYILACRTKFKPKKNTCKLFSMNFHTDKIQMMKACRKQLPITFFFLHKLEQYVNQQKAELKVSLKQYL